MAISSWNAGIIRPVPVPPAGPYENSAAPGVWTIEQATFWVKQGLWPTAGNFPPLGVFAGGVGGSYSALIQYVVIPTTGNATNFGNLTSEKNWFAGLGSATRGVFAAGGPNDRSNTIQYITFASTGNATSFGALTQPSGDTPNLGVAAASNSTRGLIAGGQPSGGVTNVIQYITIATTGNSTLFGELTVQKCFLAGCGSSTRSLFAGGSNFASTPVSNIGYVTIATTGNATSFGILSADTSNLASLSSSTRGLFAGIGGNYSTSAVNAIEYVTIATTGNSATFGSLITSTNRFSGCASSTRGLVGGGQSSNVIQYVTIASTGNATSFGNLSGVDNGSNAACSNVHGGI